MRKYGETEKQRQERIELLKLKQGIIEESEIIHEEKYTIEPPKGFKKVTNFIYHYKIGIIAAALLAVVVVVSSYSIFTRKKADMRVLVLAEENYGILCDKIEDALEKYTPDYDGNGYVYVEVKCISTGGKNNAQQYSVNRMQIAGEISTADAMLILADETVPEIFKVDDYSGLEDLSKKYGGNPRLNSDGYQIGGTDFARDSGLDTDEIITDLFFVIRKSEYSVAGDKDKMAENQKRAYEILDNIANNKKVNNESENQ